VSFIRLGCAIHSTSITIVEDTNVAIVLNLRQINCRINTDLPSFAGAVEALQIQIHSKQKTIVHQQSIAD
jgi:hypothetical protein